MSHLNEQSLLARALFAAAGLAVQDMNAVARVRQPAPTAPEPEPVDDFDFESSDSCQCNAVRHPPCSWCTSDDNPLNAEGGNT